MYDTYIITSRQQYLNLKDSHVCMPNKDALDLDNPDVNKRGLKKILADEGIPGLFYALPKKGDRLLLFNYQAKGV